MPKRHRILKKDGTESPFFWSEKDKATPKGKTVYKETAEGIKRMKGVHFDAVRNQLRKD